MVENFPLVFISFCLVIYMMYFLFHLAPLLIGIEKSNEVNRSLLSRYYIHERSSIRRDSILKSMSKPVLKKPTPAPVDYFVLKRNSTNHSHLYYLSLLYKKINPSIDLMADVEQMKKEEKEIMKDKIDTILDPDVCYDDGRTFVNRTKFLGAIDFNKPMLVDAFSNEYNNTLTVTIMFNLKSMFNTTDRLSWFRSNWTCLFKNPYDGKEYRVYDSEPDRREIFLYNKIVKCSFPFYKEWNELPLSISISNEQRHHVWKDVSFCRYPERKQYQYFLASCTMIQHNELHEVLRWLAYKKYQGFEHVTIYANDDPRRYYYILHAYIEEGYIDIIDWNIPQRMAFSSQESQLADCVHRYKGRSKYLSLEDIDEYFQPMMKDKKVVDIIRQYDRMEKKIAIFHIRNWFFRPQVWTDYSRYTFYKENWPFDYFTYSAIQETSVNREKMILKPDEVWSLTPHKSLFNVPTRVLNPKNEMRTAHYKWFYNEQNFEEDDSMSMYKSILDEEYRQHL
ncbi:hypothetical protein WA158_001426 [Blastocystis sp. Blastoise]